MNEEQLKKWLEAIESDEMLNPEINLLEIKQTVDDETLKRIKARTFEKIQSSQKIIPFKQKKRLVWRSLVAVLIVCFIPVTVLGVHHRYHYIPQLGQVIETKRPVYILSEEQIDRESVLRSLVYQSGKRVEATIDVEFKNEINLQILELEDLTSTLTINDESYEGKSRMLQQETDESENLIKLSMTLEFIKQIPKYNKNDDIVLEVKIGEGYTYSYQIKQLESALEGSSYEELGPTSTKKGISITAISTEIENELKVNFVTPPSSLYEWIGFSKAMTSFETIDYGVTLEDATGRVIKGKPNYDRNQQGEYTFKTDGLKKPYHLELSSILVTQRLSAEEPIYTLNIPDDNTIRNETKTFFVNGFKVDMTPITLTDAPRDEAGNLLNEGENYAFQVEVKFDEFNADNERLLNLSLNHTNYENPLFLGYQTTASSNGEGLLYEFYLESKVPVLEFQFDNLMLEINGDWEFFIE